MRWRVFLLPVTVVASLLPGVAEAADQPSCDGRLATIVGTSGRDDLVGTSGPDVIMGLGGDDRIEGLDGDDRICGGRGADQIDGGAGDDRLHGEKDRIYADQGGPGIAGDLLRGGPGDDLLDAGFDVGEDTGNFPNTISFDAAEGPVFVTLRGGYADGEGHDTIVHTARLTVIGSAYDDRMVGTQRDEQMIGGTGDDGFRTLGGDDLVLPGSLDGTDDVDADRVNVGAGRDQVWSHGGADLIFGEDGPDILVADGVGPVRISGGAGRDQVTARVPEAAGQHLDGGPGPDTVVLVTDRADEVITLRRPRRSLVVEGDGYEVRSVVGTFSRFELNGPATWIFYGASVRDDVIGNGAGSLTARLKGGNDEVWASAGADHLVGGAGLDTVHGVEPGDECRGFETGTC